MNETICAIAVIITLLVLGKWLFGGRSCWACAGTGVRDRGACSYCGGSGKQ